MRHVLICCLVLTVACKVKNPNFCDSPSCDGGTDAPEKCSANDTCETGVCKEPPGLCVQCLTNTECTVATMPICNTTANTCGACTKHTDCPDSNACLPDGSCAVQTEVLYVKNGGGGTSCTKAAPCADVTTALAATPTRSILRVEGTVTSATTVISSRDLTVLGDPTTSILRNTAGDVLVLDGTSKVKLYDLTIADGLAGAGIRSLGTHTGSLELQRCTVTNNGAGIVYDGTGPFTMSRSLVTLNVLTGGVSISKNITLDITNNFIVRNGNDTNGTFGGLAITNGASSSSRVEYNTLVDNKTVNGTGKAGGLFCDATLSAPNNLIARNTSTTNPNVGGVCSTASSLVQADLTGLLFKSPDMGPFDYHLKLGSGGIDGSMGGASLMLDVDGQARPNGPARDMGADEFYAQ